jgi:hypothetical protein
VARYKNPPFIAKPSNPKVRMLRGSVSNFIRGLIVILITPKTRATNKAVVKSGKDICCSNSAVKYTAAAFSNIVITNFIPTP